MLKDVLRQYDGQETHTVHLVCSSKTNPPNKVAPPPQPTMPEVSPTSTPAATSSQNRIPPANVPWPQAGPIDPNHYAMHMAWMQQAYMQYLTQQYMNL